MTTEPNNKIFLDMPQGLDRLKAWWKLNLIRSRIKRLFNKPDTTAWVAEVAERIPLIRKSLEEYALRRQEKETQLNKNHYLTISRVAKSKVVGFLMSTGIEYTLANEIVEVLLISPKGREVLLQAIDDTDIEAANTKEFFNKISG